MMITEKAREVCRAESWLQLGVNFSQNNFLEMAIRNKIEAY